MLTRPFFERMPLLRLARRTSKCLNAHGWSLVPGHGSRATVDLLDVGGPSREGVPILLLLL